MSAIRLYALVGINKMDELTEKSFEAINLHPTEIYHTFRESANSKAIEKGIFKMIANLGENKNMLILNSYILLKSLSRQFYKSAS